ncbi:efflux protein [Coprinopsis sp. MPI-PUGE-AT-0042]|nr:efflux protein [Coprinopsis sp. MPI-PUGE-AT-0042]
MKDALDAQTAAEDQQNSVSTRNSSTSSPNLPKTSNHQGTSVAPDVQKPAYTTSMNILLVATMTTAMIVNTANATTVHISIPTIGKELKLSEGELQWMASAYPLSSVRLPLLAFGRLADLYGRKTMFLVGSAFLTALTLGCAFPNDIVGILAHHFPPGRARGYAFASFSAGAPLGGIFGSAVGGVLNEFTAKTWRSTFYLMAGITLLSFICGWFVIPPDIHVEGKDKRIDWIGSFVVSAGLILVVFVLGQGELAERGWRTPYIIALLILGVALVVLFLFWERRLEQTLDRNAETARNGGDVPRSIWTPPPLIKLSIWTRDGGRFGAMMAIAFLQWCCFLGWTYWIQLYYQNYVGLTPLLTVVRMLPMTVSGILCNIFIGWGISYIPIVWLLTIGTSASALGSLLFAIIDPKASFWAYGFPATVVVVLGADFVFTAGTMYVARVALPGEQSVANGLFSTVTQLGTAVGVTASTVVFNHVNSRLGFNTSRGVSEHAAGAVQGGNLDTYHAAQWMNCAFGFLAAILSIVFFRGVGVVGQRKAAKEGSGEKDRQLGIAERKADKKGLRTPEERPGEKKLYEGEKQVEELDDVMVLHADAKKIERHASYREIATLV